MKKLFVLIALVSLSSCTGWNLDRLKKAEPKGNKFQSLLAKEYLDFSQSEADQYDWYDSTHFADKGLQAAYGKDVQPENLDKWFIPENVLPALRDAREKLMKNRTAENMEAKPETLARAQMMFDCWVEQQEENWQMDDIAACRDGFFEQIDKLETPPAPVAVPVEKIIAKKYIVYFGFDSSKLDEKAVAVLDKAAADHKGKSVEIEVQANGYADAAGKKDYNAALSEKRAKNVKEYLVKAGYNKDKISVFAYGENDQAIKTKDGVKESGNRRVEVIFKE